MTSFVGSPSWCVRVSLRNRSFANGIRPTCCPLRHLLGSLSKLPNAPVTILESHCRNADMLRSADTAVKAQDSQPASLGQSGADTRTLPRCSGPHRPLTIAYRYHPTQGHLRDDVVAEGLHPSETVYKYAVRMQQRLIYPKVMQIPVYVSHRSLE